MKLSHCHSVYVKYNQLYNIAKQYGILLPNFFVDVNYPDNTFIVNTENNELVIRKK